MTSYADSDGSDRLRPITLGSTRACGVKRNARASMVCARVDFSQVANARGSPAAVLAASRANMVAWTKLASSKASVATNCRAGQKATISANRRRSESVRCGGGTRRDAADGLADETCGERLKQRVARAAAIKVFGHEGARCSHAAQFTRARLRCLSQRDGVFQPAVAPVADDAADFARDQIAAQGRLRARATALDEREREAVLVGLDVQLNAALAFSASLLALPMGGGSSANRSGSHGLI